MKGLFLVILLTTALSGCVTRKMFDGEALQEFQAGIIYSNSHSSGPYIRTAINGKKLGGSLFTPKRAILTPGNHELDIVVLISRGMLYPGTELADGTRPTSQFIFLRKYSFDLPVQPGYSYRPEYPGWALYSQKFELCVYGEPHDAPGSKVSWARSYRKMSESAKKVICKTPDMIRTRNGVIEQPDEMPAQFNFPEDYQP